MSRKNAESGDQGTTRTAKGGMSRRQLLKGSAQAMPIVLTLHSGAALARSSNLVSGSGTVDIDGKYRCLDTSNLEPLSGSTNLYDFGEPPRTTGLTIISDRIYRTEPNTGINSRVVSVHEMCAQGGEYHYHENGWHTVQVQRPGILVSSTALSSFAGNIVIDQEL